jgi:succinate dehydrogenase / fumarate reductase, flavoprotein subunit
VQWQQMALASEAVLTALNHYVAGGGGSRGARAILDAEGAGVPMAAGGPIEGMRFRLERAADRDCQTVVRLDDTGFRLTPRENRKLDSAARPFFERDWPAWLTGAIHDQDGG